MDGPCRESQGLVMLGVEFYGFEALYARHCIVWICKVLEYQMVGRYRREIRGVWMALMET